MRFRGGHLNAGRACSAYGTVEGLFAKIDRGREIFMRALVTLFSSIGFALAGWVLPLVFPALDPLVAMGLLSLALVLLVSAGVLWLIGREAKPTEGVVATHSGAGHQFAGTFTGSDIHIGDKHTHVIAAKEPRRIDKCFWISAVVLLNLRT